MGRERWRTAAVLTSIGGWLSIPLVLLQATGLDRVLWDVQDGHTTEKEDTP